VLGIRVRLLFPPALLELQELVVLKLLRQCQQHAGGLGESERSGHGHDDPALDCFNGTIQEPANYYSSGSLNAVHDDHGRICTQPGSLLLQG
jgi:hypothetical protein